MEKQKTCSELVNDKLESHIVGLQALWDVMQDEDDADAFQVLLDRNILDVDYIKDDDKQELASVALSEYALCFDYVGAGTFENQTEGYCRWQISWGGPSDEFRFFREGSDWRVEYHYQIGSTVRSDT